MALWDPEGTDLGRDETGLLLATETPALHTPSAVKNQWRSVAILQMSKTGKGNHLFSFKRLAPSQEFRAVPPLLLGCLLGKGLKFTLEFHSSE